MKNRFIRTTLLGGTLLGATVLTGGWGSCTPDPTPVIPYLPYDPTPIEPLLYDCSGGAVWMFSIPGNHCAPLSETGTPPIPG